MATIADIAKLTRYSTATVDRVLNNRAGVREDTRQAILKAAADLEYNRLVPSSLSFDIVLPRANGFMRSLADHFTRKAQETDIGRQVKVHFIDYNAPEKLVTLLDGLRSDSAGVGLVALDHILIREALKGLIRRNVPVVTLLSDISSLPHQGYIGVDNRLAGRLAGYLIGRFLPERSARILVCTGSRDYRGHEEREMGFRNVIRESFPNLRVLDAVEIGESDASGHEVISTLLDSEADLAAIYNVGAGTAGIAAAIAERPQAEKPIFIGHDLSEDTRPHLLSGIVDVLLDQNAELTAERTLVRLRQAASRQMLGVCEVMDLRIIFRDNIPQK